MELLKGAAPCDGAGFGQEGVLGAGCAGGTVLGSRLSCAHSTYGGVGRGPGGQTHLCICFIRKIRFWGLCGGGAAGVTCLHVCGDRARSQGGDVG